MIPVFASEVGHLYSACLRVCPVDVELSDVHSQASRPDQTVSHNDVLVPAVHPGGPHSGGLAQSRPEHQSAKCEQLSQNAQHLTSV